MCVRVCVCVCVCWSLSPSLLSIKIASRTRVSPAALPCLAVGHSCLPARLCVRVSCVVVAVLCYLNPIMVWYGMAVW